LIPRFAAQPEVSESTAQQPKAHTLCMSPTKGFAVSDHNEHPPQHHIPSPDEPTVPELEEDQTIAPRPEEEIADALRAEPDVADHSQHPE
jgi:hypothetical protein